MAFALLFQMQKGQKPFVSKISNKLISCSVIQFWVQLLFFNYQVELSCPKEMAWKVNMHRGYLAICHPEEQQLNFIERLVEMASSLAIREWRRLPHIVSHVHTPLLQVGNTKCMKRIFFSLSGKMMLTNAVVRSSWWKRSAYFDKH